MNGNSRPDAGLHSSHRVAVHQKPSCNLLPTVDDLRRRGSKTPTFSGDRSSADVGRDRLSLGVRITVTRRGEQSRDQRLKASDASRSTVPARVSAARARLPSHGRLVRMLFRFDTRCARPFQRYNVRGNRRTACEICALHTLH